MIKDLVNLKKTILLFCMFLAMLMISVSASAAEPQVLETDKEYFLELCGNTKEKVLIQLVNNGITNGINDCSANLYINDKLAYYWKFQGDGEGDTDLIGLYLDINTKDEWKEIVLIPRGVNSINIRTILVRFMGGDSIRSWILKYKNKDVFGRYVLVSCDGHNKVKILWDTPLGYSAFGCYYAYSTAIFSGTDFYIKESKTHKVSMSGKIYTHTGGVENIPMSHFLPNGDGLYKLAKKMTLYRSHSKSKRKGTLKAGTRFEPLYISPAKSGLYVKVKTTGRKIGWLFFPPTSYVSMNEYLVDYPGWG